MRLHNREHARRYMHLSWIIALTMVAATIPGIAPAQFVSIARGSTPTTWPGGRWEPDPATYGMTVVSNIRVRMDDRVNLQATVAYPTDLTTGTRAPGKFPVILQLNPYSDAPDAYFVNRGYIFVSVRPRGSGTSGGNMEFLNARDAADGAEVVDWAAHHLTGSNGEVGGYGCSYTGFTQLATAAVVGRNSPLKTIIPACSGGDWIRESHLIDGIPTESLYVLGNLGTLVGSTPTAVAFFTGWKNSILAGDAWAYDGPRWEQRQSINLAQAIVRSGMPVLLWSGWNDIEVDSLNMYAALQNAYRHRAVYEPMRSHQPATGHYQIIVGSGGHGQGLDDSIMLEWYDTWLKGYHTGIDKTHTPMHLYEEGSDRWVNTAEYPISNDYTTYYLNSGQSLTTARASRPAGDTIVWEQPNDQGGAVRYTTAPFKAGATLAGPMNATIHASSSNRNLELIATLYDVAPDQTAIPVTHGTVLGSQSAERPSWNWYDANYKLIRPFTAQRGDEYLSPGKVKRFDIALFPRMWSIRPGHSLRLTLTTQTPDSTCAYAVTHSVLASDPCYLTAPQMQTLPGGVYQIRRGPSSLAASSINVPVVPYKFFATAAGGVTSTSGGYSEPLDWGH
jgi:predicted acyl esterase